MTFDEMAQALESSGDYRVIRRLVPPSEYSSPTKRPRHRAAFLDLETTGLSIDSDKIIELAIVTFEFCDEGGIYRILDESSQFEDPGFPIPGDIAALTGITDEDVAGKRFDDRAVSKLLTDAELVIAHNAWFDRPRFEARFPKLCGKAWACSVNDIPWKAERFASSSLEHIGYRLGFFYDGHRALADCRAGIHALSRELPTSGTRALKALLDNSSRETTRIWAQGSPFETKDLLKARGYRWEPAKRCWWTEIDSTLVEPELEFLSTSVFGYRVRPPMDKVTARERYSEQ